MKLIVGLGNPGKEYENTRHNVGFMILDNYLKDISWQTKFNSKYTTKIINNEKVIFVKPETYMNLSGNAVVEFANFYKLLPEDILIIHDDLDLPIGKYRLKIGSSSGGHNGIKSIINSLGTNMFVQLKIGISNIKEIATKDYVLGKFTTSEISEINKLYPVYNEIIDKFVDTDITKLMNDYNHK